MGAVFFAAIVFAGFLAALRAAGFVPAAFFLAGFATATRFLPGFASATRFFAAAFRAPDFAAALPDLFRLLLAAALRAGFFGEGRAGLALVDADLARFGAARAR